MLELVVPAVTFVLSLAVLLRAADIFTGAVGRIGLVAGISPFIIGATVVAAGTSLPELVAAVIAQQAGEPAIVAGTVVGSNIGNLFLVIGIAALVGGEIRVNRELMRVDLPLLIASTVFLVLAVWDGPFVWYEGLLGLVGLAIYVHFTLSEERRLDEVVETLVEQVSETLAEETAETPPVEAPPTPEAVAARRVQPRTVAVALASLVVVFIAADVLVGTILTLAAGIGIGSELIAITAVAIGTSLPEIAVSTAAVRQGRAEVAVGNVLGSNVFNTFAVMSLPSFLGPVVIPDTIRAYALPVMVLATVLYYFITQDRQITRWEGATLLVLYAVFLLNLL